MTERKQRNMKLVNQHRESIRKKFGIPDDKQVEINRLRAVLSARDAEIREVLRTLRTDINQDCWCRVCSDGHSNGVPRRTRTLQTTTAHKGMRRTLYAV